MSPATRAAVALPAGLLAGAGMGALLLAALWLPLSIALAGNLALDFAAGRGTAWLVLTLACAGSGLLVLAWAVLAQAWRCVRPQVRSTVEDPP